MATAAKVSTVAEIADKFRNSSAAVVTEYRGLKVSQLSKLRSDLGAEVSYTVAKNTLVRLAAAEAGVQGLEELFNGPTAIAFITGEPVTAAKALRDFARTNELLVIKGGVMDGKVLNTREVTRLADLESREVLLAKFAGAMKASLTQAAAMFNQLPSQVARLAAALQEKKVAAGASAEVATASPVAETDVPAEAGVLAEAEVPAEADVPAEVDMPAEADVPAEAEVLAEADVPAEAEVLAEADVPAEADMPAEDDVPVGADVPAEAGVPAEAADAPQEATAPDADVAAVAAESDTARAAAESAPA